MSMQGAQEFSTEIEASVTSCFATITDFSAYSRWCGPIKHSTVLELYPDKSARRVEFSLDMRIRTVRYVLEYEYDKPGRVAWRSVGGDVESIRGLYLFEKLGAKRTRATCRQAVSLGFWIPAPIRSLVQRQALRQSVLEFKAEAERRGARKKTKRKAKPEP